MEQATLKKLVADAGQALETPSQTIGPAIVRPRYELFHAANSICSQKVRAVLAHHDVPYVSHSISLFRGETYLPEYVRLRMVGCDAAGGELVAHHSGSTSAEGGCDGVVVPTLVDWQDEDVIVDSKRICLHLDRQMPEERQLWPIGFADQIEEQLRIVDNMPNYQLLMGRQVSASEGEMTIASAGGNFSKRKVAWCDQYLEAHREEPSLVRAYGAKRAKELSAATYLFSADAMQSAYARAKAGLGQLERQLEGRTGDWLFGQTMTMADLFWGIELLRMKNLDLATYWQEGRLPRTAELVCQIQGLRSVRAAILDWPGALF